MLGAHLDYLILRSLAHSRNLATEERLDALYSGEAVVSATEAELKFRKLVERFEGHFPLNPDLSYLDMGCGSGELTMAIAKRGVGQITGVDYLPRNIGRATAHARQSAMGRDVQFVCRDLHAWVPDQKYDVLLSIDAFEHIDDPCAFLRRMTDLIAPGGIAVLAFGPLFHSPFGDHMWDFFRLQVPWRGVLFSEQAVLRVRRECFRPTDPANAYPQVAGGLNLMRYSDFLEHVRRTGWAFDFLAVNAFLKKPGPLRKISDFLTGIPAVRDYFVHNVYAILRRAA